MQRFTKLRTPGFDMHARLPPQRFQLDLHRQHIAFQVSDRLRLGLVLHAQTARRLREGKEV
jgi:hypothetical protein